MGRTAATCRCPRANGATIPPGNIPTQHGKIMAAERSCASAGDSGDASGGTPAHKKGTSLISTVNLTVPTLQRGNGVLTLQRHHADERERPEAAGQHVPSIASTPPRRRNHQSRSVRTVAAHRPRDSASDNRGCSVIIFIRLTSTGRRSVRGCVPTLERGNDRSKRTLTRGRTPSPSAKRERIYFFRSKRTPARGRTPAPSRAWPAPTLRAGVHAVKAGHARETN